MAARRGKSQARRNQSNGLPGWAWLVLGVLITLLAILAVPRLLKGNGGGDGFFRPKANPDALPATVGEEGEAIAPDTAPAATAKAEDKPKPTYDFYTLLPGEEVAMTDAELAASARAEAQAQAKAAQQAAAAAAAAAAGSAGLPAPISEPAPAPAAPAPAPVATPAPTAPAAAPVAAAPAPKSEAPADARYILQAGAFGASGDAEAVKAKIALLGLNARVESAQIGGKTVYRVRMGPYGTASELADAKAKLANSGLPAMAVQTN